MNRLYYSPEALSDLDEIWTYIHEELLNPTAAQRTVSSILDSIEKLQDFAEIGASLSAITDIESDYRYLLCGNYMVFYRVAGVEVFIDRVLYGRRAYMQILFGPPTEDQA